MNKIIKNTLILTVITVVSGLLLGLVYDITKEPIAAARENTRQEAFRSVLPDASSFEEYEGYDSERQENCWEKMDMILTRSKKLSSERMTVGKHWDM